MNSSDITPVSLEGVEHPIHKLGKKTKWLQSSKSRMEAKQKPKDNRIANLGHHARLAKGMK